MAPDIDVFQPHEHQITMNDIAREYAVAFPSPTGRWQVTEERFSTRADAETAVPAGMGAVVVTREVLPWQLVVDREPWTPYAGEMDALVDQIVADENRLLRAALERGADVLVTGVGKPGRRVAHRLGCTAASKLLDRPAAWEPHHRSRLAEHRDFRLALPHLTTAAAARDITRITSCGLCRPQIFGEPLQTRSLRAEGLKTHHVDLVLSDELGADRGVIRSIELHKDAQNTQIWDVDRVTVVTSATTVEFAGKDVVFVWESPDLHKQAEREAHVRAILAG
jgi:hypothetical protein